MSERDKDKVKVKRILRSSTATGEQITKAMTDYFKKYVAEDIRQNRYEPVTADVLSIFDGSIL